MPITVVTPASSRALADLDTVLFQLGLERDYGGADDFYTKQILMVSSAIETYLNRKLAQERVSETLISIGSNKLVLSGYPIVTIHSVKYDGEELDASEYIVDYASGTLHANHTYWADSCGSFLYEVEYTYGYTLPPTTDYTLPPAIESAASTAFSALYYANKRDPNIKKEDLDSVYSVEYHSDSSTKNSLSSSILPLSVMASLQPFRKINV